MSENPLMPFVDSINSQPLKNSTGASSIFLTMMAIWKDGVG